MLLFILFYFSIFFEIIAEVPFRNFYKRYKVFFEEETNVCISCCVQLYHYWYGCPIYNFLIVKVLNNNIYENNELQGFNRY